MFKNLSIKMKLLLGFISILFSNIILVAILLFVMNEANGGIEEYQRFSRLKRELNLIENNIHNLNLSVKDLLLLDRVENLRAVKRHLEEVDSLFKETRNFQNDYISESLIFAEEMYQDYVKSIQNIISAHSQNAFHENNIFTLNSNRNSILTAVHDIHQFINNYENEIDLSIDNKFKGLLTFSLIISIGFLLISIISILILAAGISKPLLKISGTLSEISEGEGNLVQRLPVESSDEMGNLSLYFNRFTGKLHQIISKLKEAADGSKKQSGDLAASSEEISAALEQIRANILSISGHSRLLHSDTEKVDDLVTNIIGEISQIRSQIDFQSSSVTESSASIEELIASIKNLSQVSEEKSILAAQISDSSNNNMDMMKRAFESVREIAVSVDSIQDFIKIINQVASQTRLLAMNAAIEAAHAGDSGKGFSVVADEIRKLSEATSVNAKNISTDLKSVINKISGATTLNSQLEESMGEVTAGIRSVADSFSEMNMSLGEMSSGTLEISTATTDLVQSAEEVNNSILKIDTNVDELSQNFNHVKDLTLENTQSIEELSSGIREIASTMVFIAELGEGNSRNIEFIDREISRFKTHNVNKLIATDGQPLIIMNEIKKDIPQRPVDPAKLRETDPGFWFDHEYAGWNITKEAMPLSKADGGDGKNICCLLPGDHAYMDAYEKGMKQASDEFGISVDFFSAQWNSDIQEKQIEVVIKKNPDLIVLVPTDAEKSTLWFRTIHQSGIPVIGSNLSPQMDAYQYLISWTGPDDWRQVRMLAGKFGELMNFSGGYCILQHIKGASAYNSRTHGYLTELNKIAPSMECLALEESQLSRDVSEKVIFKLIKQYGDKLKGIICPDDSDVLLGVNEAISQTGRSDIITVSSGNSKIGMSCIHDGTLDATNYQPAESDGALPVKVALDWFNGINVDPVNYLPVKIINQDNVNDFLPAHW